ncbi:MAG: DUF2292 domain-containing protein [Verrucomicrobia bacterium]|nr:DUF2292 domain-containing protein [Verrucomicrobiota bacterium]
MVNVSTDIRGPELSWLQVVREQISSLRFGVVQIVVHDSKVVQLERTEKLRLERLDSQSPLD